jgi:glutamyl-tRNA synthetase
VLVRAGAPLVQERVQTLRQGAEMLLFLLVPDAEFAVDETAAAKQLGEAGRPVVAAALAALEPLPAWTAAAIEEALKAALVEGLQLKPRNAFGPVRVAVTGSTVSPPLFESMEILGRERSIGRLRDALAL